MFISLRFKFMLIMLVSIILPVWVTGYYMIQQAEQALLLEKESRLYSIAKELDHLLPETFDVLLQSTYQKKPLSYNEQVNRLHKMLQSVTDRVAKDNPGVGAGYYSKALDVVITYGPSSELKDKIGVSIGENHPGRKVLQQGIPIVYTGKQVRGEIMNAMIPLKRHDEIIGYVWANELMSDVEAQLYKMKKKIMVILFIGVLLGITVVTWVANRFGGTMDRMIQSMDEIENHRLHRLPAVKGELGRIPDAINQLLDRIEIMEEQVRRSDRLRAIGELAAGMAHEIRNPLTSIKAFSQIMEEGMAPDEENRDYLEIIIKEADRMNRLVEQLLLFGKPSIHREETFSLSDLFEQSILLVEHEIRKKDIRLVRDWGNACLVADAHLIQQVMINLLLNAVQAVHHGGEIALTTYQQDQEIGFRVFNTGSPISEEKKDHIFDPFFTSKDNGTGLGLPVSQNIVRLYHGKISFKNIETGVQFQVEFPKEKVQ